MMAAVTYQGEKYHVRKGETVLEAFLRQGVDIPFSCRSGSCHACMHRSEAASIPAEAQVGLPAELIDKGYFFPCSCRPVGDMVMLPAERSDLFIDAEVAEKTQLADGVCRILLEPYKHMDYRPGQFVNLRDVQGNLRSYSLASVPGEDYFLELHVRRVPQGKVSTWLCDTLQAGDTIAIQGPEGECYYRPGNEAQPLLLVATGTGMAPLWGILRQALLSGHTAPIHLYHGCRTKADCYRHEQLGELAEQHENLHYTAVVTEDDGGESFVSGSVAELVSRRHSDLSGWAAYLAGAPKMIMALESRLLEAGLDDALLFSDAFYPVYDGGLEQPESPVCDGKASGPILPDPEMWQALEQGDLLNRILEEFYSRVYEDPRLAPFFHGVTKQRAVEKQHLFLRQCFSGEKVYFGDRPRNAHHWMVISDELFDYREALMADCLRRHGLPENLVARWRAMEESFRKDIVKDKPWSRMLGDIELPVEGYGEMVLEVGSLCDSCGDEVAAGVAVRYHLRLGHIYCPSCMAKRA